MTERYKLYHGDCLDILPTLEPGSIDAVIADIPYGTTACAWDSVIPFEPMWTGIKHVIKPRAAVVLFGSQPFTSALVMSNATWFKHDHVWQKDQPTGGLNANRMPLRIHEDIVVFCEESPIYNPQLFEYRNSRFKIGEKNPISQAVRKVGYDAYGEIGNRFNWTENGKRYPLSVLYCSSKLRSPDNIHVIKKFHPTQKPVTLMEYLIKTYTNEGDTVLDFTMGSGSTGVGAVKTGRRFIGIELDQSYYKIAHERIANAAGEFVLTDKEKQMGQMALFEAVS